MTPKVKQAIGQLRATRADGAVITGTAFVVAERYLLTAFHMVGDRAQSLATGQRVLYPKVEFFPAGGAPPLNVRVPEDGSDAADDWALLEHDAAIGLSPIPLGEVSQSELDRLQVDGRDLKFEAWGFATLARLSGSGIAIDGRIQDAEAQYQNAWGLSALQR